MYVHRLSAFAVMWSIQHKIICVCLRGCVAYLFFVFYIVGATAGGWLCSSSSLGVTGSGCGDRAARRLCLDPPVALCFYSDGGLWDYSWTDV